MGTYFCTTCWHVSPCYLKICPRCGSSDRFCTEQHYAELMTRYLHHPMRRYRLVALKNLTWLKWKDAIPEIRERIRIEKEPDVRAQARRTLESIETYHNRNENPDSPGIEPEQARQYALISEPVCKIIPIRQMLRKKGYHHLRFKKS